MNLVNILDSQLLISLVTVFTGFAAYVVYRKQKDDSKKDAANIILLEVQNAERVLSQVGESVVAGSLPAKFLLPTDSWDTYKYLFVRDFDRDEWDNLTAFYSNCKLYDEAVRYNGSMFQKNEEQIRVNMLGVPGQYLKKFVDESSVGEAVETRELRLQLALQKSAEFQSIYLSRGGHLLQYAPQKPLNDARNAYQNINRNISQSSIGSKLKRLAKIKV